MYILERSNLERSKFLLKEKLNLELFFLWIRINLKSGDLLEREIFIS